MYRKPGVIVFFLLQLVCIYTVGQNNLSNIWYFGQNAGITFNNNNNAIAITNSNMNTPEGCAVRTEPMGNLLFYTNGNFIWDKDHNIMPNGSGLNGNPSATQSVVIVPKPDQTDTNYVFTIDKEGGPKGLQYSLVQMNLGLAVGAVIEKNIPLLSPVAEKMIAVQHCNRRDQWVIVHGWNSNSFYSFLVDIDGISLTPEVSNTGMTYSGNTINTIGYMKASPYGDKIAVAHSALGIIEIFDFNNSTGSLFNPITIQNVEQVYGLEFSPDGDILFCSTIPGKLLKFDLSLGNQIDIKNSKTLIGTSSSLLGALQRGPDGNIYVARDLSYYLGVLTNNNSWSYVNYVDNGIYLNGKKSEAGLPPFIPKSKKFQVLAAPRCFGDSTYFYFGDSTIMEYINWNFDDSITGPANFSNSFNPYHIFSKSGSFDVTAIYSMCGEVDTLRLNVCIDTIPVFTMRNDTSICENTPINLFPDFQVMICKEPSFEWSTGATTFGIYANTIGMYSVTVTNNCGSWSDSIEIINVYPAPKINLGNDTSICIGDSITLDAGNDHILCVWNTGDSVNSITIDTAGTYFAQVTNEYGCSTTDFFSLFIDPPPEFHFGNDTTICLGSEVILDPAVNSGSFVWQDGSIDPVFYVKESGEYWVQVSTLCGEDSDSIQVFVEPCYTKLFAPNSFTPNGDGLNDKFYLKGVYVMEFNLQIYNRWGQLVFSTEDMNEGWDGSFQNKKCKNEAYNWIVNYSDYFHENHVMTGQVVLVR
ncbi:gliding motility-associated C-terminal domain-containing protein [Bacteroidota bacterium]